MRRGGCGRGRHGRGGCGEGTGGEDVEGKGVGVGVGGENMGGDGVGGRLQVDKDSDEQDGKSGEEGEGGRRETEGYIPVAACTVQIGHTHTSTVNWFSRIAWVW